MMEGKPPGSLVSHADIITIFDRERNIKFISNTSPEGLNACGLMDCLEPLDGLYAVFSSSASIV